MTSSTCLVIAHRTCPAYAPENSLAGARAAVAAGADIVELDVRMSADGIPVVIHDPHLRRLGHRFARVSRLRADQLARIPILGSGQTIPTLRAVLGALGDRGVAIDLKRPEAAGAAIEVIEQSGFGGPVLCWSANRRAIRLSAASRCHAEIGFLFAARRAKRVAARLAEAQHMGAQAVSVDERIVDPPFIEAASQRGLGVYTLVRARSASTIARMVETGVRGVITDWPDLASHPSQANAGAHPRASEGLDR